MQVLHLYKDYFPVRGGIENHIRLLAESQAARGHQVTALVCAPGRHGSVEELGGVTVVRAPRLFTAASMPLSLHQPLDLLLRRRPDVVHVHAPYPLGEAAAWLVGRGRVLVITHHSDVVRQRRLLRLWGPLLRRALRAADVVIATSAAYADSSPWLRPVRAHCTVVPLGIDLPPPPARGERAPGPPRLLFVGKLRHYKGVDTLLRALVDVPDARLDVVGDGPMRAPWQALAAALALDGRVVFRGEIDDGALARAYDSADLLVLPSSNRAEAFGTVLVEAMAAGLPVVSTELGTGTSWVNQDGVTGRVVPPHDPHALAAALRALLADGPALRDMGRRARARAEAEFSRPLMVERVEQVYKRALERARA